MKGYHADIEEETKNNTDFRKALYTGKYQQLVVMSLKPGEDIGEEIHDTVDQFFRIEEGEAKAIIDGVETVLKEDDVVIVPAGSDHNLINTSKTKVLKLYTIYAPPNHPDGTVHKTKAEAEEYEKEHHHS
jgi:mannose-6-phosphate isomerase-like protein (cupin superfamily)